MCAQFHGTGTKTLEVNIPEQLTLTVSLRGSREIRDGYQLFRLTGQLDAFSEPSFRRVMLRCIDEGPAHLILDLSTIDFMDSSGLGVLVQIAKKIQANQGSLRIVTNPRVTQTVKLVRLEQFLSLVTSLEEAQAGLLAPEPTPPLVLAPVERPEPNLEDEPEAVQEVDRQDSPPAESAIQPEVYLSENRSENELPPPEKIAPIADGETAPETLSETLREAPNPGPKRNRSKTSPKTGSKSSAKSSPKILEAPAGASLAPETLETRVPPLEALPESRENLPESLEKKPKSRAGRKKSAPSQPPV